MSPLNATNNAGLLPFTIFKQYFKIIPLNSNGILRKVKTEVVTWHPDSLDLTNGLSWRVELVTLQSTNVELVILQLERVQFLIVELVILALNRFQEVRLEVVMVSLLRVVSRNVVRRKMRLGPVRVVEEISFSISDNGN